MSETVQIDPTVEPHKVTIYEQSFVRRHVVLYLPATGGIPDAWRLAHQIMARVKGGEPAPEWQRVMPLGTSVEVGPYMAVSLTEGAADEFGEVEGMSARWARAIHSVSRPYTKRRPQ